MLFVIFTEEGLAEARDEVIGEKAALWLNPGLNQQSDLSVFEHAGIDIHVLPYETDATNEKDVMAALAFVEKNSNDKAIFVEYL